MAAELADTPPLRDALQWFVRQKQWINEQHVQLCRVPASTFFEQKRAEWMLAQFRALGCVARIDRGGNVIAHLQENRTGPYVALTAHLDTVLAPRKDEEVYTTPDGRLHAPGAADNGAGLAALLAIARVITAFPELVDDFRNLVFVANVGEEGEGNLSGMRYLCRQSSTGGRIQSFLILDGPNVDHVTSQALASRRFDVSITGPGGHSWSDYGFANPVHALARAIASFTEHRLPSNGSPRSSYNFGIIEGGSSINSIPTLARTKVDIRSESAVKLDEIAGLLTSAVERALETENERATGGKVTAKIKEIGSRPGGRLPDDAYILQAVRAVDAHFGIRSHLDCASTDANVPLSMGLPAISIGAGGHGGGAHTPQEWFHPEGRELGLKRILLMLFLLLRDLDGG
jgi:tripeptide aminopeptidase